MSRFSFFSLGSGSKGNAYYLETAEGTKILIDAGLSGKAILERLQVHDIDIEELQGVFVTHDHFDHIQGLKVLANRYQIPIFANRETAEGIIGHLRNPPQFHIFSTGSTFAWNDLEIHPFSIRHDTLNPVGFTFQIDDKKIGLCTDLGMITSTVLRALKGCHLLVIEANHDPELVEQSKRPYIYKKRVLSFSGHLSNADAAELIWQVGDSELKQVVLAHLSSECNTPILAENTIRTFLNEKGIDLPLRIALQACVSEKINEKDL